MYWLQRPPVLRYVAAGLVLVVAAWIELRPTPTTDHPFAAGDIPAGTELSDSLIEWRTLPAPGIDSPFRRGEPITGTAAVAIPGGTPLVDAVLASAGFAPPGGWWTMELDLPPGLRAGTDLQLVVIPQTGDDPSPPIPAVVVEPATEASFSAITPGLVAVPPDRAADAAVAAAAGRITVLAAGG